MAPHEKGGYFSDPYDERVWSVFKAPAAAPKEEYSFLSGYRNPQLAAVLAFQQYDHAIWSHNHRRIHALYAMASSPRPGLPFEQRIMVGYR